MANPALTLPWYFEERHSMWDYVHYIPCESKHPSKVNKKKKKEKKLNAGKFLVRRDN